MRLQAFLRAVMEMPSSSAASRVGRPKSSSRRDLVSATGWLVRRACWPARRRVKMREVLSPSSDDGSAEEEGEEALLLDDLRREGASEAGVGEIWGKRPKRSISRMWTWASSEMGGTGEAEVWHGTGAEASW